MLVTPELRHECLSHCLKQKIAVKRRKQEFCVLFKSSPTCVQKVVVFYIKQPTNATYLSARQ